jgi:penicillin V acylase-like amidase (Ntn superfamily)
VRFDGPALHYLVADASGASAVVEYVHGRVRVLPRGRRPYQAMTNFVLSTSRAHDLRARTLKVVMGQRYEQVLSFRVKP